MNTQSSLVNELRNKEYREGYVAAHIAFGLPNQVRALRTARNLTQGDLAKLARMAQPRICEIEKPGERKLNIDTLMRLASALDVALDVRFLPFGELIRQGENFDPDTFSVKSFTQELAESEDREEALRSLPPVKYLNAEFTRKIALDAKDKANIVSVLTDAWSRMISTFKPDESSNSISVNIPGQADSQSFAIKTSGQSYNGAFEQVSHRMKRTTRSRRSPHGPQRTLENRVKRSR